MKVGSQAQASIRGYRRDIDGLRAVAILPVVLFHAFHSLLPGGFIGVDVFFVISGFLISSIIYKGLKEDNFSYVQFYSRRIKRIFPALFLILAACLILGYLFLFNSEWRQLGTQMFAGALFSSNLQLLREGGYFDTAASSKPLLHLWSLGIEEQFYIFWPIILSLTFRWRRGVPFVLFSGLLLSFLANLGLLRHFPQITYYLPFTRFWELLVGAVLAYLTVLKSGPIPPLCRFLQSIGWGKSGGERLELDLRQALSLVGAALIAIALFVTSESTPFPGYIALLPTVGTALIIAAGPGAWLNRAVLGHPFFVFFGLISYPLYLWHWPLLVFARLLSPNGGATTLLLSAVVLLAIFCSWLTYKGVELRIRHHSSVHLVPFCLLGLVLTLGLVGLGSSLHLYGSRLSRGPSAAVEEAVNDWSYPHKLSLNKRTSFPQIPLHGSGTGMMLFIGDSHMQQYWSRVKRTATQHSSEFREIQFITSGGCPPVPGINRASAGFACDELHKFAIGLARSPEVRTVVFEGWWEAYWNRTYDVYSSPSQQQTHDRIYRVDDPMQTPLEIDSPASLKTFAQFQAELTELVQARKQVFVVLSNPTSTRFNPILMFSRFTGELIASAPVQREQFLARVDPVIARLAAVARNAGARAIDPTLSLCPQSSCPAEVAGVPLYKDYNHMRSSYVEREASFMDVVFDVPPVLAAALKPSSSGQKRAARIANQQ
jgi:peptidoglycan/LPS O-acetylase OafA/YrhL